MRLGVEGFVGALGFEEQARGGFESVGVAISAIGLGLAKLGEILFAAAMQAGLLKMEIAQLLLVGEMSMKVDERAAQSRVVIVELIAELIKNAHNGH